MADMADMVDTADKALMVGMVGRVPGATEREQNILIIPRILLDDALTRHRARNQINPWP
jgi:hypothetical protein